MDAGIKLCPYPVFQNSQIFDRWQKESSTNKILLAILNRSHGLSFSPLPELHLVITIIREAGIGFSGRSTDCDTTVLQ